MGGPGGSVDTRDNGVRLLARSSFIARDATVNQCHDPNRVSDDAGIVSGEHERHAMAIAEVAHQVHEDFGVLAIEVGRRLICEDERRSRGDSSRHRYPLLLSSGQLGWTTVAKVGQTEVVQHRPCVIAPAGRHPLQLEDQLHVLDGGEHRDEVERLKHKADRVQAQVGTIM